MISGEYLSGEMGEPMDGITFQPMLVRQLKGINVQALDSILSEKFIKLPKHVHMELPTVLTIIVIYGQKELRQS